MNKSKKFLRGGAILCLMSILLGIFAGCGDSSNSSSAQTNSNLNGNNQSVTEEQITLTYYACPGYKEVNEALAAQFTEEHPNITVNIVELPTDSTKQFQTLGTVMQAKDSSIDVFEVDCTWPQTFISAGWVTSLDDVVTEEELAEHYENTVSIGHYEGHQYFLPVYINSGVLFYRQDILDKYGYEVPTTWEELVTISKEVMEKDPEITSGFSSAWKQYEGLVCSALEFIWDEGGDILDANGNVVINSPETAAGLQIMYDMIYTDKIAEPGINGYMWTDSRSPFFSGSVLFIRDWPTTINGANDPEKSSVAGNVGFAPLPAGSSGESYNTMGGWQVGVSAYSEHQAEAKLLAKFMSSYEAQKIRAIQNQHVPSRPAVLEDPEVIQEVPFFNDLIAVGANSKARPRSPYYEEMSAVLQQGISAILTNTMDIPTALKQMEAQLNEIVNC